MSDAIQALRELCALKAHDPLRKAPAHQNGRTVVLNVPKLLHERMHSALAAYEQRAAAPERDERAAFEAWLALPVAADQDPAPWIDSLACDAAWQAWQARATASPEHSTAPALAEVTLADPSNITAHIRWLLNPLPIGSLLYEAPAPEHSAEPVAWRPIETAPKDGTAVLVFDKDTETPQVWVAQWLEFEGDPDPAEWYALDGLAVIADPTHWMPLPAPPKDQP